MFTNAYVVSTGKKECILIDPGAEGAEIVKRLETMNLIPHAIVFTHGHIDHTSGARAILEHYRGRDHTVAVGIHADDARFLGDEAHGNNRELFSTLGENALAAFETFETDIPEADFTIGEGDYLPESDLVVMHAPGHSLGSICFYSESRNALFSGDTLFFNCIGRSDFPGGNAAQVHAAVTERLFLLPEETRVFPGHGPLTTIERERMNNPLYSEGATI